jgi:hypothetical protein
MNSALEKAGLKELYKERIAPFKRKEFPKYCEYIYVLCEPKERVIRYVGWTNDIKQRYRTHVAAKSKSNHGLNDWINDLKSSGTLPRIYVVSAMHTMQRFLPQRRKCYLVNGKLIAFATPAVLTKKLVPFLAESALIKYLDIGKGFCFHGKSSWSADLLNIRDK